MNDEDISRLYQQSRIEKPSLLIDSAVLRQARHAVEKKRSKNTILRWFLPISSFAVLMLTVSLFLNMPEQEKGMIIEEGFMPTPILPESPKMMGSSPSIQLKQESLGIPMPTSDMFQDAPLMAEEKEKRSQLNMKMPVQRSRIFESNDEQVLDSQDVIIPGKSMHRPASQSLRKKANRPPKSWLKDIIDLIKQGKTREATESLAVFKKHYPDYPLPDGLKYLIK